MKRTIIALAGAALAACCGSDAMAFRSGPPAGFSGSPGDGMLSCILCHGDNGGTGNAQILGVPANYAANQIYDLTIRIEDSAQAGAGFEMTVEDAVGAKVGTLILVDATKTQYPEDLPEWVSHTEIGVDDSVAQWGSLGNAAEFQVRWQSPASDAGEVTFYVAGNAINNDGISAFDNVYVTGVSTTFGSSTCEADLSGDGQVNANDLALMLGAWGPGSGPADLSGDNQVNSTDLALLLGAWGVCP